MASGKRPFTGDGALTVAMKHIRETPPPLPADLPPDVRELIEITLVKNPGMRYRSGGQFADAVAAVRSGRRPAAARTRHRPRPGDPAAVPSAAQARAAADVPAGPATAARARPATGSHRTAARRGARSRLASARCCGRPGCSAPGDRHRDPHRPQRAGPQGPGRRRRDGHNTITETTPFESPTAWRRIGPNGAIGHRWRGDRGTPNRRGRVARTGAGDDLHLRTDMAMTTPQHLSDRYELGEILGFGGMSEVHLARDLRLHRDVAIKVLRADLARDPSFYLRFRREAQNAAALNHPAIVAVYDTGEAETPNGPLPYIVMEYVEASRCATSCTPRARCRPSAPSRSSPTPARR